MIAAGGDIEHGVEVGRLTGGGQHGGSTALQSANLGRNMVAGGILQTGVEVAAGLQIKQLAHSLAGLVAEGGRLNDGDVAGLAVVGAVTRVEAVGRDLVFTHLWLS